MKGAKQLTKSFFYAFSGILYAVEKERNLRIHLIIAGYVIYFQSYYSLQTAEKAILIVMLSVMLASELVNTSVEKTVDLITPAYSTLAKIAKDVAAGAVLVCAIASVMVGIVLFGDWVIINEIIIDFQTNPLRLLILLLSFGVSGWFVFLFGDSQESRCPQTKKIQRNMHSTSPGLDTRIEGLQREASEKDVSPERND